MRAGMIAAPLPLLWRRADAVAALTRVGAKALITCGHVGSVNHCQLAMRVAADVFSIRYVCGFGADLPDGVVPFDDLFTSRKARSGAGARSRTGEQSGSPPCRHHLRRRRSRHRAGGAQSSAIAGRRPWRAVGKPAGAGRDHAVDAGAVLVRRHLPDAAALALERRQAFAASPVRSAGAGRPMARRRPLRRAGHARPRRVPPGRGRRVLAHRSRLRAGAVALAGAARHQSGLARARHRPGRRVHFRRDRCRRRAPRSNRPAGAAFPSAASLRRAAARARSWSPK